MLLTITYVCTYLPVNPLTCYISNIIIHVIIISEATPSLNIDKILYCVVLRNR